MVNANYGNFSEFQSLCWYVIGNKKRYKIEDLAIFLNKAPDTIQKYINGTNRIWADLGRDIVQFVAKQNPEDTEFAEFFIGPTFIPVLAVDPIPSEEGMSQKFRRLIKFIGKAIEINDHIFADHEIDKKECHREIHIIFCNIRKAAAELEILMAKELK